MSAAGCAKRTIRRWSAITTTHATRSRPWRSAYPPGNAADASLVAISLAAPRAPCQRQNRCQRDARSPPNSAVERERRSNAQHPLRGGLPRFLRLADVGLRGSRGARRATSARPRPRHVHPAFRADSQSRIPDGDSASTASISRTCSAVVPSSWTAGLVRHEREEKLG